MAASIDLSSISFFADLSADERAKVAALGEEVAAESGALLIDQGNVGQEAFFIVSGEAEVLVGNDRVATVGAGSVIGEMALVNNRPRNASVKAIERMELVSFDRDHFNTLMDTMPEAKAKILAHVAELGTD